MAVSCLAVPLSAVAQGTGPAIGTGLLPQDLSFWGMISNADWVVKAVIAGLAFASVLTWTVALAKVLEFLDAGRRARTGVAALQSAASLPDAVSRLGPRPGPCAALVRAAQAELAASAGLAGDGVKERTAWQLEPGAQWAGASAF